MQPTQLDDYALSGCTAHLPSVASWELATTLQPPMLTHPICIAVLVLGFLSVLVILAAEECGVQLGQVEQQVSRCSSAK